MLGNLKQGDKTLIERMPSPSTPVSQVREKVKIKKKKKKTNVVVDLVWSLGDEFGDRVAAQHRFAGQPFHKLY